MAEARDVRHFPKPHVGPHRHEAGEDLTRIGLVLDVTVKHMAEGVQEACLPCHEPQQIGNTDARQLAVEGMVDRLLLARVGERPAALLGTTADLDVAVLAVVDALIDSPELGFQALTESRESLFDRREQDGRVDLAQHCVFVLPARIADQIVLETAELGAVVDVDIARLQGVAGQAIHQEFVPVDLQALRSAVPLGDNEQIALQAFRNDSGGEGR
jgi:hypothetical protein